MRSIVRNFVVWLMLFALLAERWGLTKGFRIADQVCAVSICSPWMPLTRKAKRWCILSCLSKRAVETMEIQLSRKLVKLILCHCYEICHSVIDDITGPECGETISHQWIPVANDHWSGALMLQCVAMFAWMSCLTSSQWVETPWRVCDVIVMCHSPWLNIRIITSQLYWKSNRT